MRSGPTISRRFLGTLACVLALGAVASAGAQAARLFAIGDAVAVSPAHRSGSHIEKRRSKAHVDAKVTHAAHARGSEPTTPPADSLAPATGDRPSAGGADTVAGGDTAARPALFGATFDRPDGLITNDFSHWSPGNAQATLSPDWEMTSGSLFARGGEAFTGVPDGCDGASPTSSPCTASAVFRLNSARHDFGDVALSLNVVNDRLVSTARTPAVAFDGIHLWLRYQSEYELYAVSFNRRDGRLVIKKKCAGGSENGGTYYELGRGELAGFPIPFGKVQHVVATAHNLPGGAVELTLARDGATLLSAVDDGVGCAPLTASGAIGVRGDNDEFSFDDLVVSALP